MAVGATVCDFFLTELHLITQTMWVFVEGTYLILLAIIRDTARDFINDKLNKTSKSENQLDETTKDSGEDTLNVVSAFVSMLYSSDA